MTNATIWWLLAGGAVAIELLTGTFYLLMLALGLAAAAMAATFGIGQTGQMVVAAVVGGGAVVVWRWIQLRAGGNSRAQGNPAANMDIGETVQITAWNADGTADVHYRGAHWTAIHRTGVTPGAGPHRVAELVGNRLLVDKI